jgi:hypothetical protein
MESYYDELPHVDVDFAELLADQAFLGVMTRE